VQLTTLSIANFRNLGKLDLVFEQPVTAFVGENAQGKTNILEAISVLALGKSLRADEEKNLIPYGEDFYRVSGEAQEGSGEKLRIEVSAAAKPSINKVCKVNGRKVNASDLVGRLPLVSFAPEDLNLVLLSPSLRRRYIDILLSQVDRKYLQALSSYGKALKQRNALLGRIAEGFANENELEFWDKELAQHGSVIGKHRADWLREIAKPLASYFEKISGEKRKLTAELRNFHGEEITLEKYLENLEKMREKDLRYGNTNYGIHKQDLQLSLAGKPLAENGSRGEIRSSVLALKFTELEFLEKHTEKKPILLLDDVFSELDRGRQESLMQMLVGYQTFITTTKVEHLETIRKQTQIYEVEKGKVREAA
jgi:DNA replication and repair protein RecF